MSTHEGRLLFDSARQGPMVGTRLGRSPDRTLLFRAEPFSVDLVVHASSDRLLYFHGHVVREQEGTPVTGAEVRLRNSPEAVATDEYGQFAVSSLDGGGDETLLITTDAAEVVFRIPDLVGMEIDG